VHVRARDGALEVWPQPPTSGDTLALEYRSRYWVAASGSTTPTKDAPTAGADVVCLEAELVKAGLRAAFLRQKGFDSTAAQQDFDAALEATRSAAAGSAPVLRLGRGAAGESLLSLTNAPLTGFGFDGQGGLG
jgi:hypothetical protein